MKLLVFSDLHLEHKPVMVRMPPKEGWDVAIAAGDISGGTHSIDWLYNELPNDKPVIFVPGNHEYYGHQKEELDQAFREKTANTNIEVLNPGMVEIDGQWFVGATMWTNLLLNSYPPLPDLSYETGINDFRLIRYGDRRWSPNDHRETFYKERQYVEDALLAGLNPVVVTHYVPSQLVTHPRHGRSPYNPYWTADLDWMMETYKYPLHIFGHTHDRFDVMHPSGVRLVGNPRGYPSENPIPYEWKIVTI